MYQNLTYPRAQDAPRIDFGLHYVSASALLYEGFFPFLIFPFLAEGPHLLSLRHFASAETNYITF